MERRADTCGWWIPACPQYGPGTETPIALTRQLHAQVWSFENLPLTLRRAARVERSRLDVADFELRLEDWHFE